MAIDANTTYVASYHAPNGNYAASNNYFAGGGFDSPPLHALGDGVDGANGIYKYGPSGGLFSGGGPDTFQSSNYWVDVVFETDTVPETEITSGPSGADQRPDADLRVHLVRAGLDLRVQGRLGPYGSCTSPKTTAHLAMALTPSTSGPRTRRRRRSTPAVALVHGARPRRSSISGSTLVVKPRRGRRTTWHHPSLALGPAGLRPPGRRLHGLWGPRFAGCTRSGDRTANCNAAGITLIRVSAGDSADQVTNSTATRSSLKGAAAAATLLIGGSDADTLTGGGALDVLQGDERETIGCSVAT